MEIAVLLKDVPDLVEELELDDSGLLAYDDLGYVPSEFDDHALEEALLLKEGSGTRVTVVAIDTGDVDGMLFTALAKGADRAVKLTGNFSRGLGSQARARIFASFLEGKGFDLVLTGVQAIDDFDGQLPGLVAGRLGTAHAAAVNSVGFTAGGGVEFRQEYAGGAMAEFEAKPPVVLGVQAARTPPRYVSVSKVRQVTKTLAIEDVPVAVPPAERQTLRRLHRPEAAGRAQMLDGDAAGVARQIIALLAERKLVRS